MPPGIVAKLSAKINEAMRDPSVRAQLIDKGLIPSSGTPQEFGQFINAEIRRWGQVADEAGITAN
jgi:tripartite-type tricarboxylate transporter receptor subunit TctC